jgi:hypothetical protein
MVTGFVAPLLRAPDDAKTGVFAVTPVTFVILLYSPGFRVIFQRLIGLGILPVSLIWRGLAGRA